MFADRREAGRLLAHALARHAAVQPLVLGIARGGVVVANEVASVLGAPLDVWIVRKIFAPRKPDVAIGAIAEGPAVVLDRSLIRRLHVDRKHVLDGARRELRLIQHDEARFRTDRGLPDLRGRHIVVVDDAIATGVSMRAVLRAVGRRHPAGVIAAAPLGEPQIIASLACECDQVVCLFEPERMHAIAGWFDEFRHVSDEDVIRILTASQFRPESSPRGLGGVRPDTECEPCDVTTLPT